MMYYFFDEYGECFDEMWFNTSEEATEYCEQVDAEYFCSEENV